MAFRDLGLLNDSFLFKRSSYEDLLIARFLWLSSSSYVLIDFSYYYRIYGAITQQSSYEDLLINLILLTLFINLIL